MKVTILDRMTGKQKTMSDRFAKILTKQGRATYLTRDMIAAPTQTEPLHIIKTDEGDLALNDMDAATLRELAKKRGVKVHHAAGAEKIRNALIESQSEDK